MLEQCQLDSLRAYLWQYGRSVRYDHSAYTGPQMHVCVHACVDVAHGSFILFSPQDKI